MHRRTILLLGTYSFEQALCNLMIDSHNVSSDRKSSSKYLCNELRSLQVKKCGQLAALTDCHSQENHKAGETLDIDRRSLFLEAWACHKACTAVRSTQIIGARVFRTQSGSWRHD